MSQPAVIVDHLWKRYHKRFGTSTLWSLFGRRERTDDEFWALKDIAFEVQPGECLGIIGPNGSGKSTLLKILSRITKPTRGSVRVNGRFASMLEVGTGFHPDLTGRENVFLSGAILGMKKAEIRKRFDEIVAFSGVEEFIDVPVKRYSSGMYVRLAFAVAANIETDVLIVDEVLAVGDMEFQRKCLGKMGEVGHLGRTILFVSHNMAAVRNLCPRAVMLRNGRVEMADRTETVIDRYLQSGAQTNSPTVELPPAEPHSPGRGLRLSFTRSDGTPACAFRLHEPWRIRLDFQLSGPLRHMVAGLGITTSDGIPVVTHWSEPKDLEPGNYAVEFEGETSLAGGELRFTVGLSSYLRSFYYVTNCGQVTISDAAMGEQPVSAAGCGILCSSQRPSIRPFREG